MAFNISRTYLGAACSQQTLFNRVASSSKLVTCSGQRMTSSVQPVTRTRGYAAASASLAKRNPITAKGTRNDAHAKPPAASRKVKAQTPSRQPTSPEMEAARHSSEAITAAAAEAVPETKSRTAAFADMNEEERLKELEKMLAMADLMPTIDPWGQEVIDTLDVTIPYRINYKSLTKETYEQIKHNTSNLFKNSTALSSLATLNAIPGVDTGYHKSIMQKLREAKQVFGTLSVEPDSLLAPFRRMALETYEDMYKAVANRNEKEIHKLTTYLYQKHALGLASTFKSKYSNARIFWQMHRELSPTRVVSLRVTEGYLADNDPRFGNRYMVHALVKFDTEQSLEIYNQHGVPLHVTDADAVQTKGQRVPAQRKRVTEYLVMEKKMWMQGPWSFREQIWPTPGAAVL
ncbi:hypothetical protein B0H34DRAFT_509736 [Crassisporium funariophilum]|nr:hypothetical protein B0H34DRAFT_509736 [Crassisporium funariophilum]